MKRMTDRAEIVIIGGGIVGCSVLYGLVRSNRTDCLLLERRNLASGSTWHAAGNVTRFGHHTGLTRLYADSITTYLEAERESGQGIGFHSTGSLRLATTPGELARYHALAADFRRLGIEYRVLEPLELEPLHPLLHTDGLFGAAHTPGDGHLDPTGATHALATAARASGARIRTRCPALSLAPASDGWEVETASGTIRCRQVVIASSFWARQFVRPLGINLPLFALEHHEIITGPSERIGQLDFELPTVRDPHAPSNIRQEGSGFLCGVYESDPVPWATNGIPEHFAEELLEPDIGRLEPHLLRVIERIPAFGEAGIRAVNNGPICYTPDGLPLLGPVRSRPGLWLAAGFSIGIGTGGGAGRFLARWIADGQPPYDLPITDPGRFPDGLDADTCLRRIIRTYANGYALAAPDD